MTDGTSGGPVLDSDELKEWTDALLSLIEREGAPYAQQVVHQMIQRANQKGASLALTGDSPYRNTIHPDAEKPMPPDEGMSKRIGALLRWNAVAMVLRATKKAPELGGHIATYASASTLYEVGFNHFFKAPNASQSGDLIYYQGHSSPGIYARAYLEGRLDEEHLEHFRQEVDTDKGVSSYPHPWLMRDFWQFATVSMGLGPLQAIYMARFLKYLDNRKLVSTDGRKVWAFLGDGETDEPESLGALTLAGREHLNNLIFVINCNLQRLDGPVRGNGKIIQELEKLFAGAGWRVIKVIWGHRWDALLAKDTKGLLLARMMDCVDGDYQSYKARDGAYVREHFFNTPELKEMVAHLTDDEIWRLNRGGHDPQKVFAAYHEAVNESSQPVVILAKTVKGYGMGAAGEGQNITHQQKKMGMDDLKVFRDRFHIPITDEDLETVPFYRPPESSPEYKYLVSQREKLGGSLPSRVESEEQLPIPDLEAFGPLLESSKDREISTTMAMVRIFNILMKDKALGKRIIPIVPDECRTFGMEGMFRQYGIYSPHGQLYTPEDSEQLMFYKEAVDGQILEEGITEPGAFSSWIAAATCYSHSQYPLIPFYIYYSMFGFQRTGDLAWAAGDMMAKGFLVGATAGRTTLAGEGLQHCDGHSHVLANTIPNCITYDPAFSYELAVIVQHGLKRMYVDNEKVYYYLTVTNENYLQPAMPEGVADQILSGMYLYQKPQEQKQTIQLMGSGTILLEVLKAAEILEKEFQVGAYVWSVTSFNELARDYLTYERDVRLGTANDHCFAHQQISQFEGPVVAASDYMKLYAEQIRGAVPHTYVTLGTDGFGRSDTRQSLRHHFEVNADYIVLASLSALVSDGKLPKSALEEYRKAHQMDANKANPHRS